MEMHVANHENIRCIITSQTVTLFKLTCVINLLVTNLGSQILAHLVCTKCIFLEPKR